MAALARRLSALQERVNTFQSQRGRPISYLDSPSPEFTAAKLEALEGAKPGTCIVLKEENEVGGTRALLVKFPSPEYGWFSI